MTETNRQRAQAAIDVAEDSPFEQAGVQARLATAHALLAVADEIAALRDKLVTALAPPPVAGTRVEEPRSCWAAKDAHGSCTAHHDHPHRGQVCRSCPVCAGEQPVPIPKPGDRYAADIAHVEETGFRATTLRAARAAEGGGSRG